MASILDAPSGWTTKRISSLLAGTLALFSLAFLSYFFLSPDVQLWYYHSAFSEEDGSVMVISENLTDTRIERFGAVGEEMASVRVPDYIPQNSHIAPAIFGDTLVIGLKKCLNRTPSNTSPPTRLMAIELSSGAVIWHRDESEGGLPFAGVFKVGTNLISLRPHHSNTPKISGGYTIVESRVVKSGNTRWIETAHEMGPEGIHLWFTTAFLHKNALYLWSTDTDQLMRIQPDQENKLHSFRPTRHTTLTDEGLIYLHSDSLYKYSLDGSKGVDSFPLPPSPIEGFYYSRLLWTIGDTIALGFKGHAGSPLNSIVLVRRDSIVAELNDNSIRDLFPLQQPATGYKSITEFPGDYQLLSFSDRPPYEAYPNAPQKKRDHQLALVKKNTLDIIWRSNSFCSNYYSIAQSSKWNILYRKQQPHCSDFAPNLLLFDQPTGKLTNAIAFDEKGIAGSLLVLNGDRLYLGNRNSYNCLNLPSLEPIWHIGEPFQIDNCLTEIIEELEIPNDWVRL